MLHIAFLSPFVHGSVCACKCTRYYSREVQYHWQYKHHAFYVCHYLAYLVIVTIAAESGVFLQQLSNSCNKCCVCDVVNIRYSVGSMYGLPSSTKSQLD